MSRSEKKNVSYASWLQTSINQAILDNSTIIQKAYPSNVFNNKVVVPKAYSSISMNYRKLVANGYELFFDIEERVKIFGSDLIKKYETNGRILVGKHKDGRILILDNENVLYVTNGANDPEPLDSIEKFLGFNEADIPVEFAECRIFGENIPVGLVLGYLYGFEKLLNMLKVVPRRVLSGQRLNLQDFEYAISFSDETLIFNRDDRLASLVLGGFIDYSKALRSYSVYQFDKRAVYLNVLESKKITTRYLKEIDLIDILFVDPITEDILKQMKEPTTYRGLVMRSCELLMTDYHPDSLDLSYQRIRGYERVAGAIYSEMVKAVRDHRAKLGRSTAAIELAPYGVWKKIMADPAVKIVEDLNPIAILKQNEAVTFSGEGGRVSRSLTRSAREYHPNDMGVISESTVDSSDVAINTYTSANPNFTSVYGMTKRLDLKNANPASVFSTPAMLSPSGDMDDQETKVLLNI